MHYRDAVIWEKSMQLAETACREAAGLPREERFGMRAQITRAAVSVPSNIAEGWSRESRKEKAQFMAIAHGSLAELHTQLLLCVRIGWLEDDDMRPAFALIDEISRMLTVLRRRMRS
ncbi:four helix bundle protein [Luteimonas salinilitoris]|uniref:Four helix bundle protein n=1 Tax=Luteimonas salinilitoris TaxID=3237697 RepID=A0ABV4HQM4_9GAMM